MRTCLVLLIILSFFQTVTTSAEEKVLLARVVSVDKEKARLVVIPIEGSLFIESNEVENGLKFSNDSGAQDSPRFGPLTVNMASGFIPRQVAPGSVVRIWGESSMEDSSFSAARILAAGGTRPGRDPTGVRRRLGKGGGLKGPGGGRGRHGGQ